MDPEPTGSGYPGPQQDNRTTFPNNPDLVNDLSNAGLLKELLPALEKYHCLDAPVYKGRRSPWVRAFCDLYHPAGPWGENKFKKVPKLDSGQRHSFKSYKIPKILELLEKCDHRESSESHKQLYSKLKDFKSKEEHYNNFMEACKDIAVEQASKQPSERAPIPRNLVDFAGESSAEQPSPNPIHNHKELPPLMTGEYDAIIPVTDQGLMLNVDKLNGSVVFGGYRQFPDGKKGPAEISNLIRRSGDYIIAVDGVSTVNKSFDEVVDLLRESGKNKFAFLRFLEAKITDEDGQLTSFGKLEFTQETSGDHEVERGNKVCPNAKAVEDENPPCLNAKEKEASEESNCTRATQITLDSERHVQDQEIARGQEKSNATQQEGNKSGQPSVESPIVENQGNNADHQKNNNSQQEQNISEQPNGDGRNGQHETNAAGKDISAEQQDHDNSPQTITAEGKQVIEEPDGTLPEKGTGNTSPESRDTNVAKPCTTESPNVETVDDEISVGNNSFCNDDNFEEPEMPGGANGFEETQCMVEPNGSGDGATVDEAPRVDAPHNNNGGTTGEKRFLTSASDTPTPKRQRLATEEPQMPSSPDPKEVSAASTRAVSPNTQCRASDDREQLLNRQREKLCTMVEQRTSLYGSEDRMIAKLLEKINDIDEERMALIMGEE